MCDDEWFIRGFGSASSTWLHRASTASPTTAVRQLVTRLRRANAAHASPLTSPYKLHEHEHRDRCRRRHDTNMLFPGRWRVRSRSSLPTRGWGGAGRPGGVDGLLEFVGGGDAVLGAFAAEIPLRRVWEPLV